jgi:hypothetical protein
LYAIVASDTCIWVREESKGPEAEVHRDDDAVCCRVAAIIERVGYASTLVATTVEPDFDRQFGVLIRSGRNPDVEVETMRGLEKHEFRDLSIANIPVFGLLSILNVVEAKLGTTGRLGCGVQHAVVFLVVWLRGSKAEISHRRQGIRNAQESVRVGSIASAALNGSICGSDRLCPDTANRRKQSHQLCDVRMIRHFARTYIFTRRGPNELEANENVKNRYAGPQGSCSGGHGTMEKENKSTAGRDGRLNRIT